MNLFFLWVNKVKTFSRVASYTSLCLLNLRASRRLSLRENILLKINSAVPHLHLLFFLTFCDTGWFLRAESKQRQRVLLLIWILKVVFFLKGESQTLKSSTYTWRDFLLKTLLTLCCDRCELLPFGIVTPTCLKQLWENWTLLLCYSTSRVCLSTCSLATHLNEYDTDCLLFLCVSCMYFLFIFRVLFCFGCSRRGADLSHMSDFSKMTFLD